MPLIKKEENVTKYVTKNVTKNFTESEKNILDIMIANPNITQVQISQHLGVTKRTVIRMINNLKGKKIITRYGSNRNGYWQVNKDKLKNENIEL